jgi:hypothetical protein
MNSTELFTMISLHVLAALLPAVGIGHAVYRKWRPVRGRAKYKKLKGEFETAKDIAESGGDTVEVARLTTEYEERINKPDRTGHSLWRYGMAVINGEAVYQREAYDDLLKDASWVAAGLAVGAVANIWGTVISATPQ